MKSDSGVLRYLNRALRNALPAPNQDGLETHLALIERVGLQNYEQSQMGTAD